MANQLYYGAADECAGGIGQLSAKEKREGKGNQRIGSNLHGKAIRRAARKHANLPVSLPDLRFIPANPPAQVVYSFEPVQVDRLARYTLQLCKGMPLRRVDGYKNTAGNREDIAIPHIISRQNTLYRLFHPVYFGSVYKQLIADIHCHIQQFITWYLAHASSSPAYFLTQI